MRELSLAYDGRLCPRVRRQQRDSTDSYLDTPFSLLFRREMVENDHCNMDEM